MSTIKKTWVTKASELHFMEIRVPSLEKYEGLLAAHMHDPEELVRVAEEEMGKVADGLTGEFTGLGRICDREKREIGRFERGFGDGEWHATIIGEVLESGVSIHVQYRNAGNIQNAIMRLRQLLWDNLPGPKR
jgi:hypothetical protein